jgi:hypothetical protein
MDPVITWSGILLLVGAACAFVNGFRAYITGDEHNVGLDTVDGLAMAGFGVGLLAIASIL